MARENRSWGYDRIQGSLKHLGYTISDQTVGNILKRHGIPPAPKRKQNVTWGEFVRCHMDVLPATAFFNNDVWSWSGLLISYLLYVVHYSCHQVRLVVSMLQHLMQNLQFFVLGSLDVRTRVSRWVRIVRQRLQMMRFGETITKQTLSEIAVDDTREPRSEDMDHSLVLLVNHPRLIRAGPYRNRHRFRGPPHDTYLEAA